MKNINLKSQFINYFKKLHIFMNIYYIFINITRALLQIQISFIIVFKID